MERISTVFVAAGLVDILGALAASRGLTDDYAGELDGVVLRART